MSWYQTLADWLLPLQYRRRAYLKAYKANLERGRRDAENCLRVAETEAASILVRTASEAEADAEEIRKAARAEGLKSGRSAALAAVEKDREAARQEGAKEGKLAAYCEAAARLGLTITNDVRNIPAPVITTIDTERCFPNIYRTYNRWIVRVIREGAMHYKEFSFAPSRYDTEFEALIEAANHREGLAIHTSRHEVLYDECLSEAVRELGGTPMLRVAIRTCELFHLRVQQAGGELDRTGWVGDDPEDRFQAAATGILVEPWPVLFGHNQPKRITQAFANLGLCERRTVRDLLLVTPDELLQAGGFGPASLTKLRQGLSNLGLALWGDPIPSAPETPRTAGERDFRAINLD